MCPTRDDDAPDRPRRSLSRRIRDLNLTRRQAHNVPSPNEMVMDTDDYVGVGNDPEKDPIAIITPDEPESDQPLDEPLATDRQLTYSRLTPSPLGQNADLRFR